LAQAVFTDLWISADDLRRDRARGGQSEQSHRPACHPHCLWPSGDHNVTTHRLPVRLAQIASTAPAVLVTWWHTASRGHPAKRRGFAWPSSRAVCA